MATNPDEILDDPDGHFPYARDRAEQAGVAAETADWCERVVQAQETALRDPSPENEDALRDVMRGAQEFTQHRRGGPAAPAGDGDATVAPDTVNGEVQ